MQGDSLSQNSESPEWLKLSSEEWPTKEEVEKIIELELRKTSARCKKKTSLKITAEGVTMIDSTENINGENIPWYLKIFGTS